MVMSPDTSTAAMLSPGCMEVAQSLAGCEESSFPAAPPCATIRPELVEHRRELADRFVAESRHGDGGGDRRHHGCLSEVVGTTRRHDPRQQSVGQWHRIFSCWILSGVRLSAGRLLSNSLTSSIRSNGGDAADGIRGKYAQAERNCANQFSIDINRATAHTSRHVGARGFAGHLGDDDVLLGPPSVLPDADDLDRHRFRLHSLENGPGDRFHAGPQRVLREKFYLAGLRGGSHAGDGLR